MDVGKRILELRKSQGMSGNALARKSGVGQSTINRLEARDQFPTTDTLEKICDALGISLSDFFANEADDIPPDVRRVLRHIQRLTPDQRQALEKFIETI